LHAQWPWLEAGLGALRGEMPSFEWFGTVEDRGFVLLGEEPFVVIASLKGNPSSEAFERVLSALTAARTCLTGLALERVIRRIASAAPGSPSAARLVHEQGGRSASWHHPAMSESLGKNFGEQAQAAEVFHSVSMELLSQGLGKGLQRHEDYDLHVRCRGGLGIVLMARSGSDISF